jgi:serine/threonine protein kinase
MVAPASIRYDTALTDYFLNALLYALCWSVNPSLCFHRELMVRPQCASTRFAGKTYTVCGTPEYMAPEIILRKGHGKGVDVWALGALIFELVCRWTPFSRVGDDMAIMNQIKKGEFTCPAYMSADCKDLVRRSTCATALEHSDAKNANRSTVGLSGGR